MVIGSGEVSSYLETLINIRGTIEAYQDDLSSFESTKCAIALYLFLF